MHRVLPRLKVSAIEESGVLKYLHHFIRKTIGAAERKLVGFEVYCDSPRVSRRMRAEAPNGSSCVDSAVILYLGVQPCRFKVLKPLLKVLNYQALAARSL